MTNYMTWSLGSLLTFWIRGFGQFLSTAEAVRRFMNTAGDLRWSVNMPADVKMSVNMAVEVKTTVVCTRQRFVWACLVPKKSQNSPGRLCDCCTVGYLTRLIIYLSRLNFCVKINFTLCNFSRLLSTVLPRFYNLPYFWSFQLCTTRNFLTRFVQKSLHFGES